jgi:hypothetical protein
MGFFSKRRYKLLKEAIENAFLLNEGEIVSTSIYWEAAERFAQDHGAKTDRYADGGQATSFKMMIHFQEVSITFTRDRVNGTVNISAENSEDQLKRFNKKLGL